MNRRVLIHRVLVHALGAVICLSSPDALAQKKKNPDRAVAKWDKDGDGKIGPGEWTKSQKIFKNIDKDGDGYLTADEFAKHWALRAGGKKAKGKKARKKIRAGAPERDPVGQAKAQMKASLKARMKGRGYDSLEFIREAARLIDGAKTGNKLRQIIFGSIRES